MTKNLNAAVKSFTVALTAGVTLMVAFPAVALSFTEPVGAAASVLADPIGWGPTNSAPTSETVVEARQDDPIGW